MEQTLYDAVERGAIVKMVPRLDLWRITAEAILAGDLNVTYPKKGAGKDSDSGLVWMAWFLKVVNADNDPNAMGASRELRCITVDKRQFDAWLRKTTKATTGPRRGASGYALADRRHFPAIAKMIMNGEARSPHGAALALALQGKIKATGASPESAAKRVGSRYIREHNR